MKHIWEEEPISGIGKGYDGTFAIFFYGCNMRCVYCQNSKISRTRLNELSNFDNENIQNTNSHNTSRYINYSPDELCSEMLKAELENVSSVSFITGVLYVDEIVDTIKIAKKKGLKIPIVYNSSGYETTSQIKKLDGLIDIYLPDFKYFDNELAKQLSNVPNYVDVAKKCIGEMYRQIKYKILNDNNAINKPMLIVRHLVLPGHTEDSKSVIKYLYETYGDDIYLSIMSQYTPMPNNFGIKAFKELNRKLTKREYEKVVDFAIKIGVKNAFIQDGDVAKESFIPDF